MKTIYLSLAGLAFSLLAYGQIQTPTSKVNGWYHIFAGQTDSISRAPIVTVKDFVDLRIYSDEFGHSVISGKVSEQKRSLWAEATEKSIGQRIGFVFNDTVITDPQSATYSISVSPHLPDSKLLWEEAHRYRATITDSTFLKTRGMMSDKAIDLLTPGGWNKDYAYNQVVYLKALERAKRHLSVKNNQFIYPLQSGKEINISEDLHLYICQLFEEWNRRIADGQFEITKEENGFYDITPCIQIDSE